MPVPRITTLDLTPKATENSDDHQHEDTHDASISPPEVKATIVLPSVVRDSGEQPQDIKNCEADVKTQHPPKDWRSGRATPLVNGTDHGGEQRRFKTPDMPNASMEEGSKTLTSVLEMYNYHLSSRRPRSIAYTNDRKLLVVTTREEVEDDSFLALRLIWTGADMILGRTNEVGHITMSSKIQAIHLNADSWLVSQGSRMKQPKKTSFPVLGRMSAFSIADHPDRAGMNFCCVLDIKSVRQAHHVDDLSHAVQELESTTASFTRVSCDDAQGELFRLGLATLAREDRAFCA